MSNNSHIQKVVQVAEEAAPPLHVPIMLGNEILIVHQQDVRNTIDTRYLAYSRLGPNGEIIPLIVPNLGQNIAGLSGVIAGIVPCQAIGSQATQSPLPIGSAFANLQDLVTHFQQKNHQLTEQQPEIFNKSCGWGNPIAALQQMDWINNSKQLPLTNSVGTSTIELKETNHRATQCSRCCFDKQCEADIKVENKKEPTQKKDASTCISSNDMLTIKSSHKPNTSSDDEEKTKNSNQEEKSQRRKNLKTRFMCD